MIHKDQYDWLRANDINISAFVRTQVRKKIEGEIENEQRRNIFKQKM